MSISRRLLLVVSVIILAGPAGAAPEGPADNAEPTAAGLLELASAGRTRDLDRALDRVLSRDAWTDERREAVLYEFITGARSLSPERIPVRQLKRLTRYESMALVHHPESRGDLLVPRYDVAGAAAGTLELREHKLAVASLLDGLRADPAGFWSSLASAKRVPAERVLTAAMAFADTALLARARGSLEKSLGGQPGLFAGAGVVAVRLGDAGLAGRVVGESDPATARRLLESLEVFGDAAALELIETAATRPALASVAVFQAGRLAGHSADARRWLGERLDDDALGASAAAALARLDDPALEIRIIGELEGRPAGASLRHRLLYLYLRGTPSARSALADFAADPAAPESLRREVGQWF